MSAEEIEKVLEIASGLGIDKVKLTGGEPLMRNDICDIIKRSKKHMMEVSLTTNGVCLAELAESLVSAGLDRVNVSLDTLDPEKYSRITGNDMFSRVLEGIRKAVEVELDPVKVNIVMLNDTTYEEVISTMKGVWNINAVPQIIEPIGDIRNTKVLSTLEDYITRNAVRVVERPMHKRKRYVLQDDEGTEREVELVKPFHNTRFCAYCTRIRVTSDGKLKPCLMHNDGLVDILTPIREGKDDESLIKHFRKAINNRSPYWK